MKLIGIVGQINSGKDTIASVLVESYKFTSFSMADALKALCRDFFGASQESLWGPSEKRIPKVRNLLQTLGTEAARAYEPDIWVRKFEERLAYAKEYNVDLLHLQHLLPHAVELCIVVPDIRFPNEAAAIRRNDGLLIRVTRDNNYGGVATTPKQQAHVSETSQADIIGDALIQNNGSLAELHQLVHDTYDMLFEEK